MKAFYNLAKVSLKFWAIGVLYTIVKGRHIGLDLAQTGQVPALRGGTVVRVVKTTTMAWVVVVKWGPLYFAYCHLAATGLPKVNTKISRGKILGTLAWTKDKKSPGWGGTLWTGRHLHLVVCTHPDGAYRRVGATYFDPAPLIRDTVTVPKKRTPQVTTSATRVYAAPKTTAPGITSYGKGRQVSTVGDKVGSFERVIIDGEIGYILASRLVWRDRTVAAKAGLNLRTQPSTAKSSRVLATIPDKTKVKILNVDGATDSAKWAEISVGGRRGWVSRKFLK